jgi:hypothetical protein
MTPLDHLARQHAEVRCMLPDPRDEEAYLRDVLTTLLGEIEREVAGMRPSPTEFCDFYVARDDVLEMLARWRGEGR